MMSSDKQAGEQELLADGTIKAIALDAFGTLCQIGQKKNPYSRLLKAAGALDASGVRMAMTRALSLKELANELTASASSAAVAELMPLLKSDLAVELDSITAFAEVLDVLRELKKSSLKLVVVSNLAQPYGAVVKQLFGGLIDHFSFSFELAAVKPEPEIFAATCRLLQLEASQILMVGDSRRSDYVGARAFGMKALHLDRSAKAGAGDVICDLRALISRLLPGH